MQNPIRNIFDFVGRGFLATTFLVAIPPKIFNFPLVLDSVVSRVGNQDLAYVLLLSAILLLILGSVLIFTNKYQGIGAYLLLIFIVPTTFIFHLFPLQPQYFFTNLGLIGGLVLLLTRTSVITTKSRELNIDDVIRYLIRSLRNLINTK